MKTIFTALVSLLAVRGVLSSAATSFGSPRDCGPDPSVTATVSGLARELPVDDQVAQMTQKPLFTAPDAQSDEYGDIDPTGEGEGAVGCGEKQ